jgi:chorismate synthase
MSNSFGEIFRITILGESHGPAIGVVVDGCPSGLSLSSEEVQKELEKRKPQASAGGTLRKEADDVEVLSGIFKGYTTGTPITLIVRNQDSDSAAYEKNRLVPRPGHADYTAFIKYGGFNDYRGGGAFSGRLTAGVVMAGAVAKKLLGTLGIQIVAHTRQIGKIEAREDDPVRIISQSESNALHCADLGAADAMGKAILEASKKGDSLGGVIECLALDVPAGLGEPYFDTLEGQLAKAFFAIPAVKGVEFGAGFGAASKKGSQNNDAFIIKNGKVKTSSNNAGGILGGISNGMPIIARIAIKPTPSVSLPQRSINLQDMTETEIKVGGRHDACIVPRAVVVVESMMALTLVDFALKTGILGRIMK